MKSSFDVSCVFLTKRYRATAAEGDKLPTEHDAASSIATKMKPVRQPFVKNIFSGTFDQEMLLYPELPNDRLFELNSRVEKIEQFLKENGKSATSAQYLVHD